jgi:hypothetical protein
MRLLRRILAAYCEAWADAQDQRLFDLIWDDRAARRLGG